ncbi:hypothetical protein [Glaciihabitans sp. INWT7]|uniref:hypothetical protein n=1 Tax=Glaciihabitans sp. INWT7 TaxID=2596912 RepID=UPI00162A393D|nr:hypothetical protein [Glaciihabitans sp. INWT7]
MIDHQWCVARWFDDAGEHGSRDAGEKGAGAGADRKEGVRREAERARECAIQPSVAPRAVKLTGAKLVVITSFATSPLGSLADVALVVAPASGSFRHELEQTSRVPHVILLESLVEVIAARLGDRACAARSTVLGILSDNLSD